MSRRIEIEMKRTLFVVLTLLMVGCSEVPPPKPIWEQGPMQPSPKMDLPITHGFSNMNPSEKNWEITDPKFALWIEDHCYVVKPNAMDLLVLKGQAVYRLKCMADQHSDRIVYH